MDKELFDKRLEHIYKLVDGAYHDLEKIRELLEKLDHDEKRDQYRDVAGITGVFDGTFLVTPAGEKYEVPANYAAKSRICFGDTLKLIEEEGKQVYKQIEKVERRKIEGILTKKEGKWYILADSGTYKIADIAADFNKAELNEEATAYIPDANLNAPYAALDKILRKPVAGAPVVASDMVAQHGHTEAAVSTPKPTPLRPSDHKKSEPKVAAQPKPLEDKPFSPKGGATKREAPKTAKKRSAPKSKAATPKAPDVPFTDKPFKPANKEFVSDLVSGSPEAPKPTSSRVLDEDDLR